MGEQRVLNLSSNKHILIIKLHIFKGVNNPYERVDAIEL